MDKNLFYCLTNKHRFRDKNYLYRFRDDDKLSILIRPRSPAICKSNGTSPTSPKSPRSPHSAPCSPRSPLTRKNSFILNKASSLTDLGKVKNGKPKRSQSDSPSTLDRKKYKTLESVMEDPIASLDFKKFCEGMYAGE